MAWTTSAGPRGEFAHAASATARRLQATWTAARQACCGTRLKPIATVTLVHLATLLVAAPRIDGESALVLLVVFASLCISVATVAAVPAVAKPTLAIAAPVEPPLATVSNAIAPSARGPARPPAGDMRQPSCSQSNALSRGARNDLMARVSHELRTPLNAVVGFSDLMGHELFGPLGHPRYEEYVRHIRDSGHKLLKSTEDTLAITALLTSAGEASCEEVALASLARDARQIVSIDASRRSVVIRYDIDSDISVVAHRRALRQILVNLMSEGIARSSESSEILVAADCVGDKVTVTVSASATKTAVRDGHASLPVCLARTMIELGGGELHEIELPGQWRATTLLDRAVQCDFFRVSRTDGSSAFVTH